MYIYCVWLRITNVTELEKNEIPNREEAAVNCSFLMHGHYDRQNEDKETGTIVLLFRHIIDKGWHRLDTV